MNLENHIEGLIDSKREGEYWDFKREPHDNNASLLHDIISLSNSLTNQNRYLIIGVSDPKDGCEVIGLTKGQSNRKSQTELIDFLRSKIFAASIRPELELKTIQLDSKEVDVIIIYHKLFKPYFLTEDYNCKGKIVRKNFIYTRIQDTNTPIDKSADLYHVELMWKERFGLTIPPAQRFKLILLEYDNWSFDPGNKNYGYYLPQPEYKIEFGEFKDGHEPYELLFLNPEFSYGDVKFIYHSTIMYESEYVWLDGMRLFASAPDTSMIDLKKEGVYYYFLNLLEVDGLLHSLSQGGRLSCESRGHESCFIYFDDMRSKQSFEEYVKKNETDFWKLEPTFTAMRAHQTLKEHKSMGSIVNLENVSRIHQIWNKWFFNNQG